jgi:hypothetical protein
MVRSGLIKPNFAHPARRATILALIIRAANLYPFRKEIPDRIKLATGHGFFIWLGNDNRGSFCCAVRRFVRT